MTAYFVIDLTVTDPKKLEEYERGVNALVEKHGGKFIVHGGEYDVIEGDWQPQRLVIAEYPSRQAIKDFYNDPDYAPFKEIRLAGSTAKALAVEGSDN